MLCTVGPRIGNIFSNVPSRILAKSFLETSEGFLNPLSVVAGDDHVIKMVRTRSDSDMRRFQPESAMFVLLLTSPPSSSEDTTRCRFDGVKTGILQKKKLHKRKSALYK